MVVSVWQRRRMGEQWVCISEDTDFHVGVPLLYPFDTDSCDLCFSTFSTSKYREKKRKGGGR